MDKHSQTKQNKKAYSAMSNLQNNYFFKLNLQKVDWHTGCNGLIRKDNQLQSLELSPIYIVDGNINWKTEVRLQHAQSNV